MRDVVLMMTVSVDGYIRGPNGGTVPEPELLQQWKLDQIRHAGTHIMGRVTYGEMASHWPNSSDAYAKPMNEIPKVVFSKTLEEATWSESTIARGDITHEIADLKRRPGGEIIAWGGATFVQALSRARLIDEYILVIQPVAFGGGSPMFRDLPETLQFDRVDARVFEPGYVVNRYRPSRAGGTSGSTRSGS